MNRIIRTVALTSRKPKAELVGHKAKVVAVLSNFGGSSEFSALRLATRRTMGPKVLRARVRELRSMKLVTVHKSNL